MPVLRQIHRWIGLVLVLPIVLVALSGGLLVFRDAYYRTRWPVVAQASTAAEVGAQARLLAALERHYTSPAIRIVKFPREGVNAFHLYLSDDAEVLVDPRSGHEIARWHWTSDPAAFLFELHANLLMGARGEVLNGYAALLLVFLTLSGLVLWIPRRRTAFRLRAAVPRTMTSGAMLKSHAASGVILAAGVLLFAGTGAGLVFYAELGRIANAWLDAAPVESPSATVEPSGLSRASWSDILSAARHTLPEAGPTMYYPGSAGNAVLTFRKRLPGEWHPNGRSYVLIDPHTAAVVQTIDARRQGPGTRAMHALYPLHAAKTGGIVLTLAAAITAAGLTWLAVGGTWSWLARTARSRVHRSRFSPRSSRFPGGSRVIGSEELTESNWSVGHGRQERRSHSHNAAGTSRQQQSIAADRRQPRSGDTRELPLPRKDQPLRP